MYKKLKIKNSLPMMICFLMIAPSFLLASSAAGSSGKDISWFLMVTGLFGGMGMFLYGMEMMSDGMKSIGENKQVKDISEILLENLEAKT